MPQTIYDPVTVMRPVFRRIMAREEERTGLHLTELADSLAEEFIEYMKRYNGHMEVDKDVAYQALKTHLSFYVGIGDINDAED